MRYLTAFQKCTLQEYIPPAKDKERERVRERRGRGTCSRTTGGTKCATFIFIFLFMLIINKSHKIPKCTGKNGNFLRTIASHKYTHTHTETNILFSSVYKVEWRSGASGRCRCRCYWSGPPFWIWLAYFRNNDSIKHFTTAAQDATMEWESEHHFIDILWFVSKIAATDI